MKSVLIIENNDSLREDLLTAFNMQGYEGIEAKSSISAIGLLNDKRPDLILCNVGMPRMDGFKVFTMVRNNNYTKNVPFIFLTSLTSEKFIKNISKYKFTACLKKPFLIDDLLEVINKVIK